MNIEFLGLIALGILVAVLFFIMIFRDQEVAKKLSIYEKIIEDLNHEHHELSKQIQSVSMTKDFDLDDFRTEVAQQVAFEVQNALTPIIQSIKEIDEIMRAFQNEQTSRIDALEHRTKEKNFSQINSAQSNEKTIISQYKSGKSEAMIAKDLRIGIGEVDLILKLANLK